MTDWEQLSALAAGSVTYRMHENGRQYTVYTDRLNASLNDDDVHWLGDADAAILHGVLLTDYYVLRDDDESWRAIVTIGAPDTPSEPIRIVKVDILADDLSTTALPLKQLRAACVYVGQVVKTQTTHMTEIAGRQIPMVSSMTRLNRNEDGLLLHPSDLDTLVGEKRQGQRGYRKSQETLRTVWKAMTTYDALKKSDKKPTMTKRQYVSNETGLPFSNIQKQMTDAKRLFSTSPKGKTK